MPLIVHTTAKMQVAGAFTPRIDPKRRAVLDPRKKQFAQTQWVDPDYKHRLNFYQVPPTKDISLEEFEGMSAILIRGHDPEY